MRQPWPTPVSISFHRMVSIARMRPASQWNLIPNSPSDGGITNSSEAAKLCLAPFVGKSGQRAQESCRFYVPKSGWQPAITISCTISLRREIRAPLEAELHRKVTPKDLPGLTIDTQRLRSSDVM